jgi:peptide/nickel transport system substrate-binding protein
VESIMLEFTEQVPNLWTGGTATALYAQPNVRNIPAWTIPGPEGAEPILGNGVIEAQIFWSEVWLEQ